MSLDKLIRTILQKMSQIKRDESEFYFKNFKLQLQLRGRHNFLNMSRYSDKSSEFLRTGYSTSFDFIAFNTWLIKWYLSEERAIAFDPSYISKSGKSTPGLGYFWSGCLGQNKYGLEIGGFACIDILNHTALHFIADQTLNVGDYNSLLSYYAALVDRRSSEILKVSNKLVVDAYFSRKPFVDKVLATGLTIISRFRNDVALRYPYCGPHPKRRGAKTKFQGKFNSLDLDESYFTCCIEEDSYRVYEATLYANTLKRFVRVVVLHNYDDDKNIKSSKIYFSTDTTMSGIDIFLFYKARFQIEFLYRDAKQFTGLEHCQARSENKLHNHFNTSLTTVSLAKAIHHLTIPFEQRRAFSMANIKTQYQNEFILEIFIKSFGISPHHKKIVALKKEFIQMGKIRARAA